MTDSNSRGVRYALVAVLMGILVIMFAARVSQTADVTAQIRQSQVTNAKTLDQSRELLHAIQDCTQPSGQCYKRAKRATAGAVSSINRVVILAAACSAGLDRDLTVAERQTAIQSCVIQRLAVVDHKR